jgi:hypothetical protein
MKRLAACLLMGISTCSTALAGHMYGIIRENNQPLSRIEVIVLCGDERASGSTDDQGVYRLFVRQARSCRLILDPRGRNAEGALYSYDKPTAYDFDLVHEGGRWVLRRRQ